MRSVEDAAMKRWMSSAMSGHQILGRKSEIKSGLGQSQVVVLEEMVVVRSRRRSSLAHTGAVWSSQECSGLWAAVPWLAGTVGAGGYSETGFLEPIRAAPSSEFGCTCLLVQVTSGENWRGRRC